MPAVVVRLAVPPRLSIPPPAELTAPTSAPFLIMPPARLTAACVCVVPPRSRMPPVLIVAEAFVSSSVPLPAVDGGAAAVGVPAGQDQRAALRLVEAVCTGQHVVDRCGNSVIDIDFRCLATRPDQPDGIAFQMIAIGHEL